MRLPHADDEDDGLKDGQTVQRQRVDLRADRGSMIHVMNNY